MGAGNDTVVAGQGAETINGGSESDTVSYANSPRKMLINLTGQVTTDAIGVQDTLTSVENAIGSAFDDSLYGDSNGNNLDGGSDGSDLIFGGAGIDTVSYASSTRSVLINLVGQITSDGPNTDTLSSIENAIGSQFSDRIIASSEPNLLEGLGRNDSFVFRRGMAHGDEIVDFSGNGAGAEDSLEFVGYGPGATFVQLDAFNWQVNSGDGLVHEVITLQNGAPVHPSDVLFL
jgi:Ca2+-binding RTX toxin-like protein